MIFINVNGRDSLLQNGSDEHVFRTLVKSELRDTTNITDPTYNVQGYSHIKFRIVDKLVKASSKYK